MDTCIIQTPLYYKQLVWSQKCQKSYVPYLYNTDTSVKWTLGSVPLVSVLKRFDCSSFLFWSLRETVPDKGKPWFMYEAYQHIIKVQVEYLIRIGVDPALKVKIPFFTQNVVISICIAEKCLHDHSLSLMSLLAGLLQWGPLSHFFTQKHSIMHV